MRRARTDTEEWEEEALCRSADPDIFFPFQGINPDRAMALCERCEVREECLDFALKNGIKYGVWGGTTYRDRKEMVGWRDVVSPPELENKNAN